MVVINAVKTTAHSTVSGGDTSWLQKKLQENKTKWMHAVTGGALNYSLFWVIWGRAQLFQRHEKNQTFISSPSKKAEFSRPELRLPKRISFNIKKRKNMTSIKRLQHVSVTNMSTHLTTKPPSGYGVPRHCKCWHRIQVRLKAIGKTHGGLHDGEGAGWLAQPWGCASQQWDTQMTGMAFPQLSPTVQCYSSSS